MKIIWIVMVVAGCGAEAGVETEGAGETAQEIFTCNLAGAVERCTDAACELDEDCAASGDLCVELGHDAWCQAKGQPSQGSGPPPADQDQKPCSPKTGNCFYY
jgi:hypothetical protein